MKFCAVLGVVLAVACKKDAVEVRREPKEPAPTVAAARPRGLRWSTPAGWAERPGGGMRVATLQPPQGSGKIEATVVALPGDVGGERANVNRWRGQIALPPLAESDLPGARALVRAPAGSVHLYDFTGSGAKKTRLVAGMIRPDGTTWFFKLTGDATAVAAAKPAFMRLLSGLRRDEP